MKMIIDIKEHIEIFALQIGTVTSKTKRNTNNFIKHIYLHSKHTITKKLYFIKNLYKVYVPIGYID